MVILKSDFMNKLKQILLILLIPLLASSCKDEEFTMQRQPYYGNELRMNGYYYKYDHVRNCTLIRFFYRNGVCLSTPSYNGENLSVIEQELLKQYDIIRNNKMSWGIFKISKYQIEVEEWTTSVGGSLPVFRWQGSILNDTTYREEYSGEIYHFRQFSPKPDSTNKWIK
jgi:hypothetical protein